MVNTALIYHTTPPTEHTVVRVMILINGDIVLFSKVGYCYIVGGAKMRLKTL